MYNERTEHFILLSIFRILTLIGYEPNEVIGKTAYYFHNPLDAPRVSDCHSKCKYSRMKLSDVQVTVFDLFSALCAKLFQSGGKFFKYFFFF